MSGAPVSALERSGTGLEYLQKVLSGEHGNVPIGDTVGFRMKEVSKGRIVFEGMPGANVLNLIGTVHGGYAATILDSALALSILSTLDADSNFTTLEIKVNYVRSITPGMTVRATGEIVHAGRRVATSEAKLTDAEGKLLAHGTTTCLILPRERP
ncbi:PaaI family thioesterase [Usitatibacter palustris]|uniref:Thioesterase domain-containing protein n=1 Tax=Usitatibacter palustris TaxID=2732487 RepID=A0A6M4HC60_9PROT|nr:PaaI family thioesterase [Usitatibacter palustris]QJR15587.1 hypothetical protein DSM104440_02409 [Usitatibacter palustris]